MEIRTIDEGRAHRRELVIDDKPVSWLWVIDHAMRFGSETVRMAGIGGVGTEREQRMKGYMRRLFEDTVTYMIDQGYDVSMLFGIPDFYTKFGYAVCLPGHEHLVATRDAELAAADAGPYTVRPFAAEDTAAAATLYNQNNAQWTCSLVRDPATFQFDKGSWWDREPECIRIDSSDGWGWGYAILDKSRREVNVVEVESTADRLFATLLNELARRAVERRCGNIKIFAPPGHPFAEYLKRFGCESKTEYDRTGGGMMRILNLESLITKIRPELSRRVSSTNTVAAVRVETDIGSAVLDAGGAGTEQAWIKLSQDRFIQLLVGHRSARDVINDPAVQAGSNAGTVLDTLFPRSYPYTWLADYF